MDLRQLVVLLLQLSIFLTVAGFGLHATRDDLLYLVRRPRLLARSLVAMFVIMPAVAIGMGMVLDLEPAVEIALVALGISPMPPLLPRRQTQAGGRLSYGIGLVSTAALSSLVFVPIALLLIGEILGRRMAMPPGTLARLVLLSVVLPLAAGMTLQRLAPGVARAIAKPMSVAALVGLLIAAAVLLAAVLPTALTLVGNGTLLAIAVFVGTGLAVGHMFGGPGRDERVVLALSTACRHPAIAIAIAGANYPEETRVPAAIILYLLMNVVLSIPYIARQRAHARRASVEVQPAAVRAGRSQ